jgi:hypothetical protein
LASLLALPLRFWLFVVDLDHQAEGVPECSAVPAVKREIMTNFDRKFLWLAEVIPVKREQMRDANC